VTSLSVADKPPSHALKAAIWRIQLSELSREFVLYGGTGLALHLGHRNSVDFDFFGSRELDLSRIEREISFLKGANIIQRDKNTLSAIVDRGGPIQVSFFGVPNLPRLSPVVVAEDNGLSVASLLDLAGTKAFNPQITLKALSFFDDGDLRNLPEDTKLRLVAAARDVDLDRLPAIGRASRQIDEDRGHEL
jgi:hypothetical protein